MISEKYLCPININVNSESFKIGNYKFRKITNNEQGNLFGISDVRLNKNKKIIGVHMTNTKNISNFFLTELQVLKLYSCEFVIEFSNKDDIKEIPNLLLAFRLYKSKDVFAPLIFSNQPSGVEVTGEPISCKDSEIYNIDKSEIRHIRNIFKSIKTVDVNSNSFLVLERYKFAIDKNTNNKNSFIELVSILESLFLDHDIHERSFKFSLIISYILSNKIRDNVSFEQIKNIYKIRSGLVHDGKSKLYNTEMLNSTQEYTRKLILWHLRNKYDYKIMESMMFKKLKIITP